MESKNVQAILIKKPPCEQGGHLTIACHMNKTLLTFITAIASKLNYNAYFLVFFEVSPFIAVVSTVAVAVVVAVAVELIMLEVSTVAVAVAVAVFVESGFVVDSPLLLHATNAPAITKIPRNFFMRF
jgi:hypothetical protein